MTCSKFCAWLMSACVMCGCLCPSDLHHQDEIASISVELSSRVRIEPCADFIGSGANVL